MCISKASALYKEASVSDESFTVDSNIQQHPFPLPSASPMMTCVLIIGSCLSPTSKVPCRDAEVLKDAEGREGKPTSWIGYVMEDKKTFDSSFCFPSSEALRDREDCVADLYL